MMREQALCFECGGSPLIGVLHMPSQPASRALLIVTGGPQYRVGSHRQFVLLGRHLAQRGIVVMRFDYRGMGDSGGEPRGYLDVQEDVEAAITALLAQVSGIQEIVLWGLCDGATAAALYVSRDARVTGLVMLNPWVQTPRGQARTTIRHYYIKRLTQADFWHKLVSQRIEWRSAAKVLASNLSLAQTRPVADEAATLPQRMLAALTVFQGKILVILSGDDLTAKEFAGLQSQDGQWRQFMQQPHVRQAVLPQANHTFACARWRDEVAVICAEWLSSW